MMTPTAPAQQTLRVLFPQLLVDNQTAFAAREYDVAYHALMAALHCAQTLKDAAGLATVARTAVEQLRQIDQQQPAYAHSTPSSAQRGHVSIFSTLAHQAQTRLQILDMEAKQGKTTLPDTD